MSVEAVSQSHKALVKKVINKEKVEKSDVVVIVFDNDNQSTEDISQAISEIRKNNYYLFYTNQCFELWLLLHLESVEKDRSLSAEQLNKKLETYCQVEKWKNYKNENSNQIQEMFEDNVECAMKNALKLNHGNINVTKQNNPYLIKQNPYTNIHHDLKVIFNITKRL
ncbi:RloB domain-containing protein [Staphylococcus delphini]|uniref:RloB domain-containing protein n=1 Tax=Staphylococcus delphini TaxID=53344 RepID=UPI0012D2F9F2